MAARGPKNPRPHRFGGDWTSEKLGVLSEYLHRYTTALKKQSFQKWYIDGFAGSGSRVPTGFSPDVESGESLFAGEEGAEETRGWLDGSARIALQVRPAFDHFVFIERSPGRCAQLLELQSEFELPASSIQVCQGDANTELEDINSVDWRMRRAVLFLDPYGTQVEWRTIASIAKTEAIDMWVLFPLMGVSRMLTRSGEIPESWVKRLNQLFGTDDWRNQLYHTRTQATLFGEEQSIVRAKAEAIGEMFNERLRTVFAGVARRPGVLRNSRNSPLYLLCFAAANPRGAPIALRIAESLLARVR